MRHSTSPSVQPGLYWTDLMTQVMQDNGVRTRGQLATRLQGLGVDRHVVYRGLTEDWRGRVSEQLLLAVTDSFAVPHCEKCGLPGLIQLIHR